MTRKNGWRCTIPGSGNGRKQPRTPGGREGMGFSLEPPRGNAALLAP